MTVSNSPKYLLLGNLRSAKDKTDPHPHPPIKKKQGSIQFIMCTRCFLILEFCCEYIYAKNE